MLVISRRALWPVAAGWFLGAEWEAWPLAGMSQPGGRGGTEVPPAQLPAGFFWGEADRTSPPGDTPAHSLLRGQPPYEAGFSPCEERDGCLAMDC